MPYMNTDPVKQDKYSPMGRQEYSQNNKNKHIKFMWEKIKYKKILYSLSLSVLFSPVIVKAQTTDLPYTNPSEYDNFGQIVQSIAEFLAYIAFPLAAVMIIYTGIKFLLARGSEQKVTEAKETFRWVIIGTAVAIGAYAIVLTIRTIF